MKYNLPIQSSITLWEAVRFLAYGHEPVKAEHADALGYFDVPRDEKKELPAKRHIFLALSSGRITAQGIRTEYIGVTGELSPEAEREISEALDNKTAKIEQIPAETWSMLQCIDWSGGKCWKTSVYVDWVERPPRKASAAPPPINLGKRSARLNKHINELAERDEKEAENYENLPPSMIDMEIGRISPPQKPVLRKRETVYSLGGYVAILLNTAEFIEALNPRGETKSPLTHSGGPGPGSAMHLYKAKLEERFKNKKTEKTLAGEARVILAAVSADKPHIRHAGEGAIRNGVRARYNEIKVEVLSWSDEK